MNEEQTLLRWCNGNESAVRYLVDVYDVIQVWDDLVDEDPVTEQAINGAFVTAMARIPSNPFFIHNSVALANTVMKCYLDWQAANRLERVEDRTPSDLDKAYVLRASYYSLVSFVAYLCGGTRHAEDCSTEIWRGYHESLEEFHKEF